MFTHTLHSGYTVH